MNGIVVTLTYTAVSAVSMAQMDRATPINDQREEMREPDVSRGVGSTDEDVHITAEDVLRALRERRPSTRIITPSRMGGGPPPTDLHFLLPDGSMLPETTGRLSLESGWWVFLRDDVPSPPPLRMLRNATLEGMVRTVEGGSVNVRFRVSGEVTEFQGKNYLLPRIAARLREQASKATARNDKTDAMPTSAENATALRPTVTDASADDVLDALSSRGPRERLIDVRDSRPEPTQDDTIVTSSQSTVAGLLPDGTPLVSRPGRLTPRGRDWVFVFESDHPDHPEPPMPLLPNKNLELMVDAAAPDATGLVFMVSGEVTVFRGQNFLLPRVARRVVGSGNLRK